LRDLTARVPHIFGSLGCRILHLLPVAPTPTTYARFGQFGSPYATLDLTAIDPALVSFDGRTTAEDQFRELADAVHAWSGMVFLDLVVHHTGWGSRLMEQHPGWFRREPDGRFRNPGAWGVVWGDLVELEDTHPHLWDLLAEALLVWCRRGVDGFRCDAGYMVPLAAWQYIQARVRQIFPDTVFLLEGLGGAWELTEGLLGEGGMQWAYSELFQNYDGQQVSAYLDHAFQQLDRLGPLVHYSETHDNPRLAVRSATWSLMRNRLCALTSGCGAFGYTSGWSGWRRSGLMSMDAATWPGAANPIWWRSWPVWAKLLSEHPCFFDGARLRRLSPDVSQVFALERISKEGADRCLVLVNLDPDDPGSLVLQGEDGLLLRACTTDLLGQSLPPDIPWRRAGRWICAKAMPFALPNRRNPEAWPERPTGKREHSPHGPCSSLTSPSLRKAWDLATGAPSAPWPPGIPWPSWARWEGPMRKAWKRTSWGPWRRLWAWALSFGSAMGSTRPETCAAGSAGPLGALPGS